MNNEEFKQALEGAGFTRYSFAKKTGMQWETVNRYYNGTSQIKKKTESIIRLYTGYGLEEKNKKQKAK